MMTNHDLHEGLHEWMHVHGATLDAIAHDTGLTREDVRYLAVLVMAGLGYDEITTWWKARRRSTSTPPNPYSSVEEAILELRALTLAA